MDKELQEIIDKDKIRTVLYRNARGLDRLDEDLVRSTYHDDAWDYHGTTDGPATDFIKSAMTNGAADISHGHMLAQSIIQIDGDKGFAETYFLNQIVRDENATLMPFDESGEHLVFTSGRYIDHFEKRDGEWKIAKRKVLLDFIHADKLNNMGIDMNIFHRPKRTEEDESYHWEK